jgi:hypothetical protein
VAEDDDTSNRPLGSGYFSYPAGFADSVGNN